MISSEFRTIAGLETRRVAPKRDITATEYMFILGREEVKPVDISASNTSSRVVRRPLGQEFKKDTYAYIEVLRQQDIGDTTKFVPLAIFNSNHQYTPAPRGLVGSDAGVDTRVGVSAATSAVAPYSNNFLIMQTNEVREEKFQLLETFGDNFVFFFGERPRFFDVTGLLLNSNSHQWKKEWWLNYDRFLRGTRAVENKSIVTLHVDNVAISGYLLTSSAAEDANNPRQLQFTFRMLVTDYVFEDSPIDSVRYFADNLWANNQEGPSLSDGTSVADVVEFISQGTSKVLQNSVLKAATATIAQSVFGNPLGGITEGIAAAATVFSTRSGAIDLVDQSLKDGLGSFVEFDGKPPGLYSVGGETLQQQGIDNLVASVDNSLSILLNMERSPVVQSLTAISSLIQGAASALSASQQGFAHDGRAGYSEFLGRAGRNVDGALVSGSFMGYDFIMPFKGLQIDDVNPAETKRTTELRSGASVDDKVAAGVYGSKSDFDFYTLSPTTGSAVDFEALKADENYQYLPRSWRIRIETDPETMSQKIVSSSRANEDGDLKLLIRRSKSTKSVGSNLSAKIDKALGA